MKLLYTNKNIYRLKISEPLSIDEAINDIKSYISNHNSKFKIPYTRLNIFDEEIEVDVGSWADFFYITDATQNDIDKFYEGHHEIKKKPEKHIFITNGMARCGKDTFAAFLNEYVPTMKYSSIDKVKEIAKSCGWTGGKTERDRKFLSDLKVLTSEYSDMPFNAVKDEVNKFLNDDTNSVMLIDIREPEEIEKAKNAFGAKTILIENNRVEMINSNMADANVFNYTYDYIIQNNGTLEEYKMTVKDFVERNIIKRS